MSAETVSPCENCGGEMSPACTVHQVFWCSACGALRGIYTLTPEVAKNASAAEIARIDEILDEVIVDASESEVAHQIEMHRSTLDKFVRVLARYIRKIDDVGKERRIRRDDRLDAIEEARGGHKP